MKRLMLVIVGIGLAIAFTSTTAAAQQATGAAEPVLHVSPAYSSCFFDLHPELTQAEFQEFVAELGSILRFRQVGDVARLGKGHVDIGLHYTSTPIDDSKGAWNNTMSHPAADHYLGGSIQFPRIVARFGLSDRVDFGAWGGVDAHSNYGIVGAEFNIALMNQGPTRPVSVSIRPSFSSLVGPKEVWVGNASIDVAVSRAFGRWSPYVGVGTSASLGVERSNDVNLDSTTAETLLAYAGVAYRWRSLVLAAEAENGQMPSYAFRISTRF